MFRSSADERAVPIIFDGLIELDLTVHHERAAPSHGLADFATRDHEQARANGAARR